MAAIKTRWTGAEDAAALAAIHAASWRWAYAGLLPGGALERRIAARGPRWWAALHRGGGRALGLELEGRLVGYARLGPSRGGGFAGAGEIYELYLAPECCGAGLGGRLFRAARAALRARGLRPLIVRALAGNEMAQRFYLGLGGRIAARGRTLFGGAPLDEVAFAWP